MASSLTHWVRTGLRRRAEICSGSRCFNSSCELQIRVSAACWAGDENLEKMIGKPMEPGKMLGNIYGKWWLYNGLQFYHEEIRSKWENMVGYKRSNMLSPIAQSWYLHFGSFWFTNIAMRSFSWREHICPTTFQLIFVPVFGSSGGVTQWIKKHQETQSPKWHFSNLCHWEMLSQTKNGWSHLAFGSPLAAKRMKPSGSVPPETHLAGPKVTQFTSHGRKTTASWVVFKVVGLHWHSFSPQKRFIFLAPSTQFVDPNDTLSTGRRDISM